MNKLQEREKVLIDTISQYEQSLESFREELKDIQIVKTVFSEKDIEIYFSQIPYMMKGFLAYYNMPPLTIKPTIYVMEILKKFVVLNGLLSNLIKTNHGRKHINWLDTPHREYLVGLRSRPRRLRQLLCSQNFKALWF